MSRNKSYQPGEIIFEQGQAAESAFVVKTGRVRLVRRDESGETELALVEEGAIFGEAAFTEHNSPVRYASALAAVETELTVIGIDQWRRFIGRQPEAIQRFIKQMIGWLHRTSPAGLADEAESLTLDQAVKAGLDRTKLAQAVAANDLRPDDLVVKAGLVERFKKAEE